MTLAEKKVLSAIMNKDQSFRELRWGLRVPSGKIHTALRELIRDQLVAYNPISRRYQLKSHNIDKE